MTAASSNSMRRARACQIGHSPRIGPLFPLRYVTQTKESHLVPRKPEGTVPKDAVMSQPQWALELNRDTTFFGDD